MGLSRYLGPNARDQGREVALPPLVAGPLFAAPGTTPATRRYTSTSNRLAWRTPTTNTIVAASNDGTHLTGQQTTTC
ncbi:MAG TPA: hypothetical protein VGJ07_17570 [Rugosimonospora sp.]